MTQDAWISFREATELTKTRLNASAGHAEALVRRAVASGEVRTQAPPILLAADDGVVGMDLRAMDQAGTERLSELDLVDWLDRNSPTTTSKPRPQLDRERAKAAAFAIWGELGATEASGEYPHLQGHCRTAQKGWPKPRRYQHRYDASRGRPKRISKNNGRKNIGATAPMSRARSR